MSPAKVAVLTTSRADYGHLFWFLRAIQAEPELELLLYVTGSHLSPSGGSTVRQVEADGFPVARKIEILLAADTPSAAAKAMSLALAGFADAMAEDRPSVLVLLGDRFEIVPVALAAVLHGIPIAHIHGGETSEGALDESFRHAVTKLSTLHFPAAEPYRRRILQMGEAPESTHLVGAPGLDHLHRTELLPRAVLQATLGLSLEVTTALVTYHPVTTEPGQANAHVDALLAALLAEAPLQAVFSKANADAEGQLINARVESFCESHPERFRVFDSLGTQRFLSCLQHLDLCVGNSSSGLIEAPSFALPVVNVGNRQRGRLMAANVIQAGTTEAEIRRGIRLAASAGFRERLTGMTNPYDRFGDGRVGERIVATLRRFLSGPRPTRKTFTDVDFEVSNA